MMMYYRKKGLMNNKFVRLVAIGAFAATVAYAGDAYDFKETVQHATHLGAKVAEGYYNPYGVSKVIKYEDGTVKGYLVDNKTFLPLLSGTYGVQAGSAEYVWNNLIADYQEALIVKGWHGLPGSQKIGLLKSDLESIVSDFIDSVKSKFGR